MGGIYNKGSCEVGGGCVARSEGEVKGIVKDLEKNADRNIDEVDRKGI